jgi:hypothetical protein
MGSLFQDLILFYIRAKKVTANHDHHLTYAEIESARDGFEKTEGVIL